MKLQKVGSESIKTIQQLANTIWPVTYGEILSDRQLKYMLDKFYSELALKTQIEELKHQFILVKENEEAVGFASYSAKNSQDPSVFQLHKIYIHPKQQGKGTGKLLLNFIANEIKMQEANSLELNVNRRNNAIEFYKKIGFEIIRGEDIDIGNGFFMTDYVMQLRL
jgi:diamine N-acetyltransferase